MKLHPKQYLGVDGEPVGPDQARVIILPVGYEGGVSYGTGTAKGPDAILDASCYLELYDRELDLEPCQIGICTADALKFPDSGEGMVKAVRLAVHDLLSQDKFVVSIGGDHSITTGYCQALADKYPQFSVIQIDAHADLRHSYEGSIYSHASVMARIRELTTNTLQLGIRSMSIEEAERIKKDHLSLFTMTEIRSPEFNLNSVLGGLPDPVFITFDVDVFDWSVVRSTGTPEPGGILWDEAVTLLKKIFDIKNVIGFDVVELAYNENDPNSAFAIAKLIYKMIGYKFFQ